MAMVSLRGTVTFCRDDSWGTRKILMVASFSSFPGFVLGLSVEGHQLDAKGNGATAESREVRTVGQEAGQRSGHDSVPF